jgi:phage shock protein A
MVREVSAVYQQAYADIQASYNDLRVRFDKLSGDFTTLRAELDSSLEREKDLRCRVESLMAAMEKQEDNVRARARREVELTDQIAGLQQRVWTLEKQNEALTAQVGILQNDRDHWKALAENSPA